LHKTVTPVSCAIQVTVHTVAGQQSVPG
jgi:hypothetical protein